MPYSDNPGMTIERWIALPQEERDKRTAIMQKMHEQDSRIFGCGDSNCPCSCHSK